MLPQVSGYSRGAGIPPLLSHTININAVAPRGRLIFSVSALLFSWVYHAPCHFIRSLKQICTAHFSFNLDEPLLYEAAREW